MEKIKLLGIVLFTVIFSQTVNAQEESLIKKGLVRAQLTLSPSYAIEEKQSYFYLHGNLEAYLEDRISLVGDSYMGLGGTSSNNTEFEYKNNGFFGINYHFVKNNNDLYVGFQPGLSLAKLDSVQNNIPSTNAGISPLFSSTLGYNFYVNRFFHFFIQNRIVLGNHNYDLNKSLAEYFFSAGLGFNLQVFNR